MFKSQFINSTFNKTSNKVQVYLFNVIKIHTIRTNEII